MDELVITREEFRDRYFKPVRAGTWNVIVKSLGTDYSEAERSLEFFLNRYKTFYFKISYTVAKDGVSNSRLAIIMGNGLSEAEADYVVKLTKKYGAAMDACKTLQHWDTNSRL